MRRASSNAALGGLILVQRPEQAHHILRRRLHIQRKGALLKVLQPVRIAGVEHEAAL